MKKIHIESRNYKGKLYSIELPKGDIAEEFRTYLKKNGVTYYPSEAGDYIHFSMWYENDDDAQKADDYLDVIWSKYESVKKPVKEAYDENDDTVYVRVYDNWDTDTDKYIGDTLEGVCIYGNKDFYFWGDEDDMQLYDNINKYLDDDSDIEAIKYYCRVDDEQAAKIRSILDQYYHQMEITEDDIFPAILQVVHGQKYYHSTIRGATQGDWAKCVYPQEYGYDFDDYIESVFFNLGKEVEISEDPDFKDSYWDYVPISYPSAKDIKDYVAKNYYHDVTVKLLKPRQVVSYEYDEYDESVKRKSVKESKDRKYTVKELRDYVRTGMATDITNAKLSSDELHSLEVVGLSFGVNGMNGGLFQDRNTGEFYVITARNSNLFRLA